MPPEQPPQTVQSNQPAMPVQPPIGPTPPVQPTVPPPSPFSPQTSQNEGSKKKIIMMVVVLALLAGGAAAFLLTKNPKTSDKTTNSPTTVEKSSAKTQTTASSQESASKANPSPQPSAAAPSGWVTKERNCFKIALPADNDLSDTDNSCLITAYYGKDKITSVNTYTFTVTDGTLAENVSKWKSQSAADSTIISETTTKVGGQDADAIVYKGKGTYATPQIVVLVYTGSKYKIENIPVNGFQILGRYDDQYSSKTTFDQILASWQWK